MIYQQKLAAAAAAVAESSSELLSISTLGYHEHPIHPTHACIHVHPVVFDHS